MALPDLVGPPRHNLVARHLLVVHATRRANTYHDGALCHAVLLQQPIEAAPVDAQCSGGAGFVALLAFQDVEHVRTFDVIQTVHTHSHVLLRIGRRAADFQRQVFQPHHGVVGENFGPLDGVDKLPDIAGPRIRFGQNVWQSLGGQEVGSVWGHGAYVAPDWSADWLHREASWILDRWSRQEGQANYEELHAETQAALQARLREILRANTYDADSDDLVVSPLRAQAIEAVGRHYAAVFGDAAEAASLRDAYAIPANAIKSPERQRLLNAFFFWASWACVTQRPGSDITYTQNWPAEPLVGNAPTGSIVVWSVLSFVLLLAGIGALACYFAVQHRHESDNADDLPAKDPLLALNPTPSTAIFLSGGIIGTFHHLYFTGTPTAILALGATFSAMEVVPLVLTGFEAYENLTLTRARPWVATWCVRCFPTARACRCLITAAGYQARLALHYEASINKVLGRPAEHLSDSTQSRDKTPAEKLLKYLLFTEETPLDGRITGTSQFAQEFAARGPRDRQDRSLRDFDLERRLFKYPCSYEIYSAAFDGLPDVVKDYVYRRLYEVLTGQDQSSDFARLSTPDRQAIREILCDTKPGSPEYWK